MMKTPLLHRILARANVPFVLALAAVAALATAGGCAGTAAAYRQAADPAQYAFVVTEQYAALVREAATLRRAPATPPSVVAAMQRAELAVRPFVVGSIDPPVPSLRSLAQAWEAAKDAQSAQALQAALDAAVRKLVDLVNAVNAARGAT